MKTIALVIHENYKLPSGVLTVVKEFIESLPNNYCVYLITNSDNWIVREFSSHFNSKAIRLITFPNEPINQRTLKFIEAFITICQFINFYSKNNVDCVFSHSGGWPGGSFNRLAIISAFIIRLKTNALIIHNFPVVHNSWFKKIMYKFYAKLICLIASDVVTVSNACKLSLIQYGFDRKIRVIYNGIRGFSQDYHKIKYKDQFFRLGFLGEITPRKGIELILDACNLIEDKCFLRIGGNAEDTKYLNFLKNKAKCLKHKVEFIGYVKNTVKFLNEVDVLILPSKSHESFGMVLVEAMRQNVPVICSDVGGMVEVVKHDFTGLVFSHGNYIDLYRNISRIKNSPRLAQGLARNAKLFASKNFDASIMTSKYLELI